MISVAVLVAVAKQCLQSVFLLVFVELYNRKSIFLLLSSKLQYRVIGVCLQINYMWLQKAGDSMFFELGLNGSGLGLMIFHKMNPTTHHNYL